MSVHDFGIIKKRKALENNISDLRGIKTIVQKTIIDLTRYKNYRTINIKLNELQSFCDEILFIIAKRKDQLELLKKEEQISLELLSEENDHE